VAAGSVPSVITLLGSDNEAVAEQAISALAFLAAGNSDNCTAIRGAGRVMALQLLQGSGRALLRDRAASLLTTLEDSKQV